MANRALPVGARRRDDHVVDRVDFSMNRRPSRRRIFVFVERSIFATLTTTGSISTRRLSREMAAEKLGSSREARKDASLFAKASPACTAWHTAIQVIGRRASPRSAGLPACSNRRRIPSPSSRRDLGESVGRDRSPRQRRTASGGAPQGAAGRRSSSRLLGLVPSPAWERSINLFPASLEPGSAGTGNQAGGWTGKARPLAARQTGQCLASRQGTAEDSCQASVAGIGAAACSDEGPHERMEWATPCTRRRVPPRRAGSERWIAGRQPDAGQPRDGHRADMAEVALLRAPVQLGDQAARPCSPAAQR